MKDIGYFFPYFTDKRRPDALVCFIRLPKGLFYAFFWVIPRRLNFISQFRRRGISQKKAYNIQNTAKV